MLLKLFLFGFLFSSLVPPNLIVFYIILYFLLRFYSFCVTIVLHFYFSYISFVLQILRCYVYNLVYVFYFSSFVETVDNFVNKYKMGTFWTQVIHNSKKTNFYANHLQLFPAIMCTVYVFAYVLDFYWFLAVYWCLSFYTIYIILCWFLQKNKGWFLPVFV